jgi:hypothetical protein
VSAATLLEGLLAAVSVVVAANVYVVVTYVPAYVRRIMAG